MQFSLAVVLSLLAVNPLLATAQHDDGHYLRVRNHAYDSRDAARAYGALQGRARARAGAKTGGKKLHSRPCANIGCFNDGACVDKGCQYCSSTGSCVE